MDAGLKPTWTYSRRPLPGAPASTAGLLTQSKKLTLPYNSLNNDIIKDSHLTLRLWWVTLRGRI
jgi:hypothetical protein